MNSYRYIKWDEITHGKNPNWDYIRHKENTDSLKKIAPHLRAAFSKRFERHQLLMAKKFQIIALAEKTVYLLKMLLNRKNGIPRW